MSVITIARQFGAGGKTLGSEVAQKLGYTLIDEQIVEMVALEADVSPEWVDSIAQQAGTEGIVARLRVRRGRGGGPSRGLSGGPAGHGDRPGGPRERASRP